MTLGREVAEPALLEYLRCWEEDDRAGWLSLFAQDASIEDPVGGPPTVGAEAIAAFWDRIHQGEMAMTCTLDRIVVCGEEALMLFAVTTSGAGVTMTVRIADLFTFDDAGHITSMRAYWDEGCMSMG